MLSEDKRIIEENRRLRTENRLLKSENEKLKSQLAEKKISKSDSLDLDKLYKEIAKIEKSIEELKEMDSKPTNHSSYREIRDLQEELYNIKREFEKRIEELERKVGNDKSVDKKEETKSTRKETQEKEIKEEVKQEETVEEKEEEPIIEPRVVVDEDANRNLKEEGYEQVTSREQATDLLISSAVKVIKNEPKTNIVSTPTEAPAQTANNAAPVEPTPIVEPTSQEPAIEEPKVETPVAPEEPKFEAQEEVVAPTTNNNVEYTSENIKVFKMFMNNVKNTYFSFMGNDRGTFSAIPTNVKESWDKNLKPLIDNIKTR